MRIRRVILFLAAVFILCQVNVFAQGQMTTEQRELADYIKDHYTKTEVYIPMRDGVRLFTSVYEPKDKSQKYPIMLERTPYTVAPYGKDKDGKDRFKTTLGPDDFFAREGYIFVYQDVRGCWMSEGSFEDMRPETARPGTNDIDESTDGYDTVDWLIKNVPNNNRRVGIYGSSYPGFYTSTAIINSHPAIKAASPQAPAADWFHGDDMHHNGALFLAQNYSFAVFFGQPRPAPTSTRDYVKKPSIRFPSDGYNFFLNLGGLKNSGDYFQKVLGIRLKFWDEMTAHPNYDKWWEERNVLPKLKILRRR